MASTTRRSDERSNRYEREQHEATIRSIDETKDNIRRAIEEARREVPNYSQTVTDFQNETADATREIADTFLESQKDVVNSMQSAWTPMAERAGYWMGWMQQPSYYWWTGGMSPKDIADLYARMGSSATENFAASTRMATNVMFAGMEAARATTRYARQNAKEMSRITSNSAKAIGQTTRETIRIQSEGGSPSATSSTSGTTVGGTATMSIGEEGGQARGETGTTKRK